jgi:hypothetical protein
VYTKDRDKKGKNRYMREIKREKEFNPHEFLKFVPLLLYSFHLPLHPLPLLSKSFKTPELQPHNRPLMVTIPLPPSF